MHHGWHCGLRVASLVIGYEDLLGADRLGSLEGGEALAVGILSLVEVFLSVYALMFLSELIKSCLDANPWNQFRNEGMWPASPALLQIHWRVLQTL